MCGSQQIGNLSINKFKIVAPLHFSLRVNTVFSFVSDVMKMGFSKPWPEAMKIITAHPKMSVQPLMEYFKPLIEWLEKENKKNGDVLGWPEYDWTPYKRKSGAQE